MILEVSKSLEIGKIQGIGSRHRGGASRKQAPGGCPISRKQAPGGCPIYAKPAHGEMRHLSGAGGTRLGGRLLGCAAFLGTWDSNTFRSRVRGSSGSNRRCGRWPLRQVDVSNTPMRLHLSITTPPNFEGSKTLVRCIRAMAFEMMFQRVFKTISEGF